ncbi:MAG: hypothetical protein KC643_13040, partial [Nitrospira sp.]|nr:hypothetical protein [Nitrospira sp.]
LTFKGSSITIAKTLRGRFFFAHPYAAWERGLNENTNGLIRQYFPKQKTFCHHFPGRDSGGDGQPE